VISDTHGLLRPEAEVFLRGCDRIVHGGDIGTSLVLDTLAGLAPVTAVRGNNDKGAWADALPETALLDLGAIAIYVIHDRAQLKIETLPRHVRVIVTGHSHKPVVEQRGDLLFVNPGSAGPRRFKLPVAVAELKIDDAAISARIVELI
jgi:putative phosphoesterase